MKLLKKKSISKDVNIGNLELHGKTLVNIDTGYEVIFVKSDLPKLKKLIKNLES